MSTELRGIFAILVCFACRCVSAQSPLEQALAVMDDGSATYEQLALDIWNLAEVGFQEYESSGLLQAHLASHGFDVDADIAGMPTAFVAEAGNEGPVIAILAEFDALPGITQAASPVREPLTQMIAGHACGHHLFGTGSVAAAVAVKEWLAATGTAGRIRVYGTPAEEGGGGKVYMVRAGLFDDVDVVLHWHADSINSANSQTTLANLSAKFRFSGVSAHAAAAPDRGRSALDGVEAMNMMVNLMREHIPDDARIHYVITNGGAAPNVVPDFAEVYYYARHPDPDVLFDIFERIERAAEGAALGTGTTVEREIINGVYSVLPNGPLAKLMHESLEQVGGVRYDFDEYAFAETLRTSLPADAPPLASAAMIESFNPDPGALPASTDVGDVSWVVPTTGLRAATWVPGTAAHSWQAVAAGGTSIGTKGMFVAARTLARTAIHLFEDPEIIGAAAADYRDRVGDDFRYEALLGDRPPALDYRSP